MTDDYPDLVVEIHRYENPATYRFFTMEPGQMSARHMNYTPFRTKITRGPNYIETHREQVDSQTAAVRRKQLHKDKYTSVDFRQLNADLAFWVTHNMAPVEFHQGLDQRDPGMMQLVTVWVRGELPQ